MNRKFLIILSIVLSLFSTYRVINYFVTSNMTRSFQADDWWGAQAIYQKSGEPLARLSMAKDVIKIIQGKTENEVLQMLGEDVFFGQNREEKSKNIPHADHLCHMLYRLNMMDQYPPVLCIELADGKVIRSSIADKKLFN
ncbi:MAG: hypothetical protein K2P81_13275 [Bacteriovoracaceae bacterium]|nr:hypothetical protein [Bacteriovoracaceae bacterium]